MKLKLYASLPNFNILDSLIIFLNGIYQKKSKHRTEDKGGSWEFNENVASMFKIAECSFRIATKKLLLKLILKLLFQIQCFKLKFYCFTSCFSIRKHIWFNHQEISSSKPAWRSVEVIYTCKIIFLRQW